MHKFDYYFLFVVAIKRVVARISLNQSLKGILTAGKYLNIPTVCV